MIRQIQVLDFVTAHLQEIISSTLDMVFSPYVCIVAIFLWAAAWVVILQSQNGVVTRLKSYWDQPK